MTVSLSMLAGAGAQFSDDNGAPLAGGLLYTYTAGTTTPLVTYQTSAGSGGSSNSNPIVLDSAGRVPYQIWLTDGVIYKFVLKTSGGSTVRTEDNVYGGSLSNVAALSASSGSSLVGFIQTLPGSAASTVQEKLREQFVSVVADFNADNSGATNAATQIQNAIDSGASDVFFPAGDYLINASLIAPDNVALHFSKGALLKAASNGLTLLKSTTHAYGAKFFDPRFSGNGKTGVVAMDMTNCRLDAGVFNPYFTDCDTGFIGRDGCFGLPVVNPTAFNVDNPVVLLANNSGMVISTPNFDNSVGAGGTGTGSGITIQYGSGSNLGVRVDGGYIQGFTLGVDDGGISTILDSIYFEQNTAADVTANTTARHGNYSKCGHWAAVGAAAYRFRNTDAMVVEFPTMTSGSRAQMFDIDATNTNGSILLTGSNASFNSPLGDVSGTLVSGISTTFTVTDGSGAALSFTQNTVARYSVEGDVVTVTFDITFPVTASGSNAKINLPISGKSGASINAAVGYTDYGAALVLNGTTTGVNILLASSGSALTNANLTGKRFAATFSYIVG